MRNLQNEESLLSTIFSNSRQSFNYLLLDSRYSKVKKYSSLTYIPFVDTSFKGLRIHRYFSTAEISEFTLSSPYVTGSGVF